MTGNAEAESPSIPWQGYHLRPRTAQNPRPAMALRSPPAQAAAQAAVAEAEMEVSASLGPIKKRLKVLMPHWELQIGCRLTPADLVEDLECVAPSFAQTTSAWLSVCWLSVARNLRIALEPNSHQQVTIASLCSIFSGSSQEIRNPSLWPTSGLQEISGNKNCLQLISFAFNFSHLKIPGYGLHSMRYHAAMKSPAA